MADDLHEVTAAVDAKELLAVALNSFDGPPMLMASAMVVSGLQLMRLLMVPDDCREMIGYWACREIARGQRVPAANEEADLDGTAVDIVRAMFRGHVRADGLAGDLVAAMLIEAGSRLRRSTKSPEAFEVAVRGLLQTIDEAHRAGTH